MATRTNGGEGDPALARWSQFARMRAGGAVLERGKLTGREQLGDRTYANNWLS